MKTAERSMLIIEDNASFRETFIDVMQLRGIDIRGAARGADGLGALQRMQPSVIVLDVQLPDVNGIDLCRLLRSKEAFKSTPIVLLSASTQYNDARDRAEGLQAGATLFLSKSMAIDKILAEIDKLFQGRGPCAN